MNPITLEGWTIAVEEALKRLPHDLRLRGMGHEVDHDPNECVRCRAESSLREIVNYAVDTDA